MGRNVHTFKASVVEKSFAQAQEIDYKEIFLLVVEKFCIWLLVPIVTF